MPIRACGSGRRVEGLQEADNRQALRTGRQLTEQAAQVGLAGVMNRAYPLATAGITHREPVPGHRLTLDANSIVAPYPIVVLPADFGGYSRRP